MMNKKCTVLLRSGEMGGYVNGTFLGVFQHAEVVGASPMIGGHVGGTVAYPIAVVMVDDRIERVQLKDVKFIEEETLTLHADGETYTFGKSDLGDIDEHPVQPIEAELKNILSTANGIEQSYLMDMLKKFKSKIQDANKKERMFVCWYGNIRFEGCENDIDDIRGQIAVLEKNGLKGPLTIPLGVQMTTYNKK